jgi:hypothetical protein
MTPWPSRRNTSDEAAMPCKGSLARPYRHCQGRCRFIIRPTVPWLTPPAAPSAPQHSAPPSDTRPPTRTKPLPPGPDPASLTLPHLTLPAASTVSQAGPTPTPVPLTFPRPVPPTSWTVPRAGWRPPPNTSRRARDRLLLPWTDVPHRRRHTASTPPFPREVHSRIGYPLFQQVRLRTQHRHVLHPALPSSGAPAAPAFRKRRENG